MDYFPLFIRINGARCLVVGGGEVALRKCKLLLRAKADITVLAPDIDAELGRRAAAGEIRIAQTTFTPDTQLSDYRLIIAATNERQLNQQIAAAADRAGIYCNVVDDRELSTAIMPAIVDRSPVVVAVSSSGESPVLATRVRQQIEQLLPSATGKLARFAGHWRGEIKQRLNSVSDRRAFWQRIFDGPIAEQVLRGETDAADAAIAAELSGVSKNSGFAWIVGAGPGDPELLTLKAARVLATADTILHDRLVAPAILDMARRDARFISVGKQAGQTSITQEEINRLLIEHVQAGERVCRLKGGDPFIFGRGGEEVEALDSAGLPWQVIPGITAASGCAAAAGVPLTHREVARAVTFVTGHTANETEPNWDMLSHAEQTVVFYMGVRQLKEVCIKLTAAGRPADCPALIVENGTTDQQRMIRGTLATLAERAAKAAVSSPALVIVGPVADLNELVAAGQLDSLAADAATWAPAATAGGL